MTHIKIPAKDIRGNYKTENPKQPIELTIVSKTNQGFIVKHSEVFGFLSFFHMPWKYSKVAYWEITALYLINIDLKGYIYYQTEEPFKIVFGAFSNQFSSPLLLRKAKYKCLILNKSHRGLLVEIGIHFHWKHGSIQGEISKNDFEKKDSFSAFNNGDIIHLFYIGKNHIGKNVFSSNPKNSPTETHQLLGKKLNILKSKVSFLEYALNNNEPVEYKIYHFTKKGFYAECVGLFAFIPLGHMPWKYTQLVFWEIISPYIVSLVFTAKIYKFNPHLLSITLNGTIPQFKKPIFKLYQFYLAIILDISKSIITLELGNYFNWTCGSILIEVPSYLISKKEQSSLSPRTEISVIYLGTHQNQLLFGTKKQDEIILNKSLARLINNKISYLEELKNSIRIKFIHKELVDFQFVYINQTEFYVLGLGIFGYIPIQYLPWQYPELCYWQRAFPYLKDLFFKGYISGLASDRILFYGEFCIEFDSPPLFTENKIITAILLDKTDKEIIIDTAYHYQWKTGSQLITLSKNKHNNKYWNILAIGNIIEIKQQNQEPLITNIYNTDNEPNEVSEIRNKNKATILNYSEGTFIITANNKIYDLEQKYMPWEYQRESLWSIISNNLINIHFTYSIDSNNKIVLCLNKEKNITKEFILNKEFNAILLLKGKYHYTFDLGAHFSWQLGSFIFNIPIYHFRKNNDYINMKEGQMYTVYYWGINKNLPKWIFGYDPKLNNYELNISEELLGKTHIILVRKDRKSRLYFTKNGQRVSTKRLDIKTRQNINKLKVYSTFKARISDYHLKSNTYLIDWVNLD